MIYLETSNDVSRNQGTENVLHWLKVAELICSGMGLELRYLTQLPTLSVSQGKPRGGRKLYKQIWHQTALGLTTLFVPSGQTGKLGARCGAGVSCFPSVLPDRASRLARHRHLW